MLLQKEASSQFSPTTDIDFLKNRFEMILDGIQRNMQGRRDLCGWPTPENTLGDLSFALRKTIGLHDERRDFHWLRGLKHHGDLPLLGPSAQP